MDALGGLTTVNILLCNSIVTQINLETKVFNVVVMVTRRYAAHEHRLYWKTHGWYDIANSSFATTIKGVNYSVYTKR